MRPSFLILIASFLIFSACASNKHAAIENELSGNKILILGVIEYDYSQLKNKEIKGLDVFLDTKDSVSNISLPESKLKNDPEVKQRFISSIGQYGNFNVSYRRMMPPVDKNNLLAMMNAQKYMDPSNKTAIQEYTIEGGKIINIGKITVKYFGGEAQNGRISYSYTFQTNKTDSMALEEFKKAYPKIFKKYAEEVYMFKN